MISALRQALDDVGRLSATDLDREVLADAS
jgi:hypothetical protein